MNINQQDLEDIQDSISYISGVFPPKQYFNQLVNEGSDGSESHVISGDDLAGACHHLNHLMEFFDATDYTELILKRMEAKGYDVRRNATAAEL